MMKRNKLYTVNRFNRPLFTRGENIFWTGGSVNQNQFFSHQGNGIYGYTSYPTSGNASIGWNTQNAASFMNNPSTLSGKSNYLGADTSSMLTSANAGGKGNAGAGSGSGMGSGMAWASAAPGIGAGWSAAWQEDPQYSTDAHNGFSLVDSTLTSGKKSKVGMGLVNSGASVMNAGLSSGNGTMALIGGIAGTLGTIINNGWGYKVDSEKLEAAERGIKANQNFVSRASSLDDIQGPVAQQVTDGEVYKGGVFTKGKAKRKNRELRKRIAEARDWANRSVDNNVFNLVQDMQDEALANYAALGGQMDTMPMNNNMGAIEYGLMSDYLNTKKKNADNKNQMNNMFMGTPSTMFVDGGNLMENHEAQLPLFAFGGDMQTNSADFPTGLTHINAGGSHEENPNDGVQMGVDNEGIPNLVEEGETVYNDYVFSNRITCDETTKKLFHLPKKKDVTYAEVSKKLEREISERPNDPISRAGFNAQMQKLEEQQERQKQEMEAERAKAAFEALSPEEQTAVMQQVAQQEAARENLAAQAMTEQNLTGGAQSGAQNNPEEMIEEQPTGDTMGTVATEQPVMAEGGKLFKEGGDKKKNVGTWKDDKENHWDVFTKPGLKAYIESIKQRLAMAPDDATKDAIRKEAMNELNSLQQSYFSHVLPDAGKEKYDYSEDIKNHQLLFDKLYGNTGFYSTDDNGNVRNLIADAINLPNGAATEDKPEHWADGYNGRRTSIRNFGSTEYGDDKYYKDLVDEFAQLGLTYAPNENWKYGDNQLYALSMPEATAAKATEPKVWDWNTGDWVDKVEPEGKAPGTVTKVGTSTVEEEKEKQTPKQRPDWMRYAGLFGPAAGLGLMAAGVGKPDYSDLDAAISGSGNVALADYKPLGNYLTYRPMDIWFEQNRMDANARATDRAIANNAAPIGTKMAGLLASGYNNQIASGELYRKALEYNDEKRKQVAEFNRGTDMFNAEAYNRTSQFNAGARNDAYNRSINARLHGAQQKLNSDAGWYNGLYGNVAGLFRGLGDLGRENAQWNMISKVAADTTNLGDSNTSDIYLKKKKKSQGGKVRRKKGLTY